MCAAEKTQVQRRRGAALESAVLEAAWQELMEKGFAQFTLEGVAKRAETSRPVLHRRWPGRLPLATAAMGHHVSGHPIAVPDLGNLRAELRALMQQMSQRATPTMIRLFLSMSDALVEAGSSFETMRKQIIAVEPLTVVLQRSATRGEIDLARMPPRVASLPTEMVRLEVLNRMASMPDAAIDAFLDQIYFPLLQVHQVLRGTV